jgi:hypothetical protein
VSQTVEKGLMMQRGFYLPTCGRPATPGTMETLVTRGEALRFRNLMLTATMLATTVGDEEHP